MFTDATHIRINGERGVLYTGDGDRLYVRFGGSVTWRNFNPGALESRGGFSERHGAINIIQRYAVFPDETIGWNALMALLVGPSYIDLTLWTFVRRYYGKGPDLACIAKRSKRRFRPLISTKSTCGSCRVANWRSSLRRSRGKKVGILGKRTICSA